MKWHAVSFSVNYKTIGETKRLENNYIMTCTDYNDIDLDPVIPYVHYAIFRKLSFTLHSFFHSCVSVSLIQQD